MKRTFMVLFFICAIIHDGYSKGGGRGGGGRGGGGGRSGGGSKGRSSGGSSGGSKGSSGSRSSGGSSSWGGHTSISRGSTRTLAAGLAGGYVGYKGAKLARKVSSGSSYMYYPSYHRTYYYGNRYYSQSASTYSNDQQMCTYKIESGDEYFDLTYESDGTRVTEIIYHCGNGEECCEGLECCNRGLAWWVIVFIVIICISLMILMVYFAKKACSCQKMVDEDNNQDDYQAPKDTYPLNPAQPVYPVQQVSMYTAQQVTAYPNPQEQTFVPHHQQLQQNQFPPTDFVPTYMQMGLQKPENQYGPTPDVTIAQPPPPYGLK